MKTSELCKKDVVTVAGTAPLTDVSKMMRKRHVGSVVVTDSGIPMGIVTDRDIVVEVIAMGLDPATVTAKDVMSSSPAVIGAEDDVMWALKTMRDRGVRRLPVVDGRGQLQGIIAFDDLMQHVGTTLADIAHVIGTERLVESIHRV